MVIYEIQMTDKEADEFESFARRLCLKKRELVNLALTVLKKAADGREEGFQLSLIKYGGTPDDIEIAEERTLDIPPIDALNPSAGRS